MGHQFRPLMNRDNGAAVGVVVAVGQLKGGVGKSSLAVNLGASWGARGRRVELLDCDTDQGTAVEWAAGGTLPVQVVALAPGADPGRQVVDEIMRRRDAVDALLLDLPPQLGPVVRAALVVADLVVLPVPASPADVLAAGRMLELVREGREARASTAKAKPDRPRCLLVPSRVDRRTASGREIEAVLHDLGEPVAPAVAQRSAWVDALGAREWVGRFAPRSPAHQELEALAAVAWKVATR